VLELVEVELLELVELVDVEVLEVLELVELVDVELLLELVELVEEVVVVVAVVDVVVVGLTAPDWIWLSWLPSEPPSSWCSMKWYGPPLIEPEPRPTPQAIGSVPLTARCPAISTRIVVEADVQVSV